MAVQSLINHGYSTTCVGDRYDDQHQDEVPDCGHFSCGLLCDVAMANWRLASQAVSDFQLAVDAIRDGGDMGRAAVQALLDTGASLTGVAAALGVHPHWVCGLVVRADYRLVLQAEELLRAGGMTRLAVAKQVGLEHQSVQRLARALGVPLTLAPTPGQDQRETIIELRRQGLSVRAIAAKLGVSKSTVSRISGDCGEASGEDATASRRANGGALAVSRSAEPARTLSA